MLEHLDLRVYDQELVSWWQHPLVVIGLLLAVAGVAWAVWFFIERARARARRTVWAQLDVLLATNTDNGRDQAVLLSGVCKLALAHCCRQPIVLSFSDRELLDFIAKNERLAACRTDLADLLVYLSNNAFMPEHGVFDPRLHEQVRVVVSRLKGLSYT